MFIFLLGLAKAQCKSGKAEFAQEFFGAALGLADISQKPAAFAPDGQDGKFLFTDMPQDVTIKTHGEPCANTE